MPDIKKPTFPLITTRNLETKLTAVNTALEKAKVTDAGGGQAVDVKRLEAEARRSGDPTVERAVDAIVDRFVTYQPGPPVTGGCGGGDVKVTPAKLDAAQVREVAQALADAKQGLAKHLGNDATLSWNEATQPTMGPGLAGNIGRAIIQSEVQPYQRDVRAWAQVINRTAYDLKSRGEIDGAIEGLAKRHGASGQGQEAIRWAFRAAACHPEHKFYFTEADKALRKAETSWMKHIPFIGRGVENAVGHLSDGELRRFFKTDDLGSFIEAKKAEVKAQVGSYPDNYLKGTDLPGTQYLNDPDVKAAGSGC